MALCHFIIAIIFAKNEDQWPTHKAAGWGAVAMVWLFVIHFGYCIFPLYSSCIPEDLGNREILYYDANALYQPGDHAPGFCKYKAQERAPVVCMHG